MGLQVYRSDYCGDLAARDVGRKVILAGWVHRRRDHGGLIFIDLRDREGIVQVVFSPEVSAEAFKIAEAVRGEYVLRVEGEVRRRPPGTENPRLKTGEVEVYATACNILNRAKTPPFLIEDEINVDEDLRLRYRYLDLRRPEMQEAIRMRHRAAKAVRDFLDAHGFWEIETPMLTKSTPEGARDYLVPSRVNPGRFYALPQSPQLFKQILMVAGMDRYFQIVRCFRDEDLRADRQPEFTQIDIEMSFVDVDDVLSLSEALIAAVCREVAGVEVKTPFPRLTYADAMEFYGTDKPDLRYGMRLTDVSDLVAGSEFKVFAGAVAAGGCVKGIAVPGAASFSRREIDELTRYAALFGAKGLAYIQLTPEGPKSPILKFFKPGEIEALAGRLEAGTGDLLLFVADRRPVVQRSLGALRTHLAAMLGLVPAGFAFLWVVDFPLLEYDETEQRYVAVHHPFTAPREEDIPLLATDPGRVRAKAYDLVLNGVELGGGSIRIHRREVQEELFRAIDLRPEEAAEKFGFLLEAFEYGAPPHGGIAFGFDRLLMLLLGRKTIRDVIPFPKTQSAQDLMTGAPAPVTAHQLAELHIRLQLKEPAVARAQVSGPLVGSKGN
ncbi:aspartyl-tRNA synthetase [Thermodesulfitimonas autotrophica]|uniref:Aspartate--tRNA(Asp/Asn) ligase n=2 Tax=Thermodesulfitimonas autotrophica TaxID=1894989 RepID=A0A3N5AXU8_9THEO|nr:aspartate--tRNA ligase [Thermodesulfitimonas autotrophica]RPF49723.1 aspartyl-tRNA synthetase [Thermodesulfitimonas autotrophica]